MKFSIKTILWAFALLASAIATFGAGGVLIALLIISFWAYLLTRPKGAIFSSLLNILFILAVLGTLLVLFLPALPSALESSRMGTCLNNMKQIAIALHNYHDENGSFPPAAIVDHQGKPMHSWRIQLLPHLELDNLFKQYNFNEPWDGPNNKKVTNLDVDHYNCPSDHDAFTTNYTSYYAVVDQRTMLPGSTGKNYFDIPDGAEETIFLIEAPEKNSAWADPNDLSFEEAVKLLTTPADPKDENGHWNGNGFFWKPTRDRIVVFADAHSGRIKSPISRELATALLTYNGGEEIDIDDVYNISPPELDYTKIYVFAVFIILTLVPILKLKQARQ